MAMAMDLYRLYKQETGPKNNDVRNVIYIHTWWIKENVGFGYSINICWTKEFVSMINLVAKFVIMRKSLLLSSIFTKTDIIKIMAELRRENKSFAIY